MNKLLSPSLSGKCFIIVHGYLASPKAHWFPWLSDALKSQGAEVVSPAMPNPAAPAPEAWAGALTEALPNIDDNTFLIGHSLGCVTLLRHLLAQPTGTRAGGYVLVSGFGQALKTLPELTAFTTTGLDHVELQKRALHRASVISADDEIVSPEYSRKLASDLNTSIVEIRKGGHFLDRDGFTELPVILELLSRMVSISIKT